MRYNTPCHTAIKFDLSQKFGEIEQIMVPHALYSKFKKLKNNLKNIANKLSQLIIKQMKSNKWHKTRFIKDFMAIYFAYLLSKEIQSIAEIIIS